MSTRSRNVELVEPVEYKRGKPVLPPLHEIQENGGAHNNLNESTSSNLFDADETLTEPTEEIQEDSIERSAILEPIENHQEILEPADSSSAAHRETIEEETLKPRKMSQPTISSEQLKAILESVTTSNKPVPHFNGKDIDSWLFQFEEATKGQSDDARIGRLATILSGSDAAWFMAIKNGANPPTTFEEWKSLFQTKFTEALPVLLNRLRSRKQLENEDPETYCRDIIALSKKVNPTVTAAEIILNMTAGVLEKFRRDITVMKPTTEDDFIRDLKILVAHNQANSSSLSPASVDSKVDKLTEAVFVMTELIKKQMEPKMEPRMEPTYTTIEYQNQRPERCQICRRRNHTARKCHYINHSSYDANYLDAINSQYDN